VTLGLRRVRVEPDPVVAEHELDLVAIGLDRQPHVRCLGMLQRVHHSLTRDVVQQERDRGRQFDLVDVGVELNLRVTAGVRDEAVKGLAESSPAER
jgi:hypothetical protein